MTIPSDSPPRVAMVAYTRYETDPRVRRDAESLIGAGLAVALIVSNVRFLWVQKDAHQAIAHVYQQILAHVPSVLELSYRENFRVIRFLNDET